MEKFTTKIVGVPDRENLIAEVYYKNAQWAEISNEQDQLIVHFFSPLNNQYWEFFFDEALEALQKAKNRLLSMGPPTDYPFKYE